MPPCNESLFTSTDSSILEDLLLPGLDVVICGTAAGNRSAKMMSYYAHSANKFWRTLYEVGLTDQLLNAPEFRKLVTYRIGLTDLAKTQKGMDRGVELSAFDGRRLSAKVNHIKPKALAFNGKRAGQIFLNRRIEKYGRLVERLGSTAIFVLPSTSGAAAAYWSIEPWRQLAHYCGRSK